MQARIVQGFFRASRWTRPVQNRKLSNSRREDQANLRISRTVIFSAHIPE